MLDREKVGKARSQSRFLLYDDRWPVGSGHENNKEVIGQCI